MKWICSATKEESKPSKGDARNVSCFLHGYFNVHCGRLLVLSKCEVHQRNLIINQGNIEDYS